MPEYNFLSQPPSRVKVGKAIPSIQVEYISTNLDMNKTYIGYLDISNSSGNFDSRACSRVSCSGTPSPSAGKPDKLSFSFDNVVVNKAGTFHFVISVYDRKYSLSTDWTYLHGTGTSSFTAKK